MRGAARDGGWVRDGFAPPFLASMSANDIPSFDRTGSRSRSTFPRVAGATVVGG